MIIKPRTKTCKNASCGSQFIVQRMGQTTCCAGCLYILNKDAIRKGQERAERKDTKTKLEAFKKRSEWIAEVQVIFNRFIRLRDADQPCIDCGKPFEPQKFGGSVDAGHYLSRGSACHLRFDERNVHAQRKNCNRPGGTTRAAFKAGMEARIGKEALEALESDQDSRELTIDELKALKALYTAKVRHLTAQRELNQEAA